MDSTFTQLVLSGRRSQVLQARRAIASADQEGEAEWDTLDAPSDALLATGARYY